VFEKRVLRRIFGPKRDEVRQNVGENCLMRIFITHSSPSPIRIIKLRRMQWVWHVARLGRRGMQIGTGWDSQKGRDH
jgi:hypothetical protein